MRLDLVTFLFQLVNFVVLLGVLWRFLWTPLRKHMSARAERIAGELQAIQCGRDELERGRAELASALAKASSAGDEARRRAEREAEVRAAEILEAAHRAAVEEQERLRAQVQAQARRREQTFLASLAPTLALLMQRILAELGGTELQRGACDRFARELEGLPAEERERVREWARTGPVDLATAGREPTASLIAALRAILPAGVEPALRQDAELGAGARLRVGEWVLDGSLAAQTAAALRAEP